MPGDSSQFDLFGFAAQQTSTPPARPAVENMAPAPLATAAPRLPRAESRRPAAPAPLEAPVPIPLPSAAVLSVSELTLQLKGAIEGRFSRVAVLGEVSNCRRQASGHVYFTLKDDGACVSALIWRREAQHLSFELTDGLQLVCQGRLEIYGPHGKYQLIVDRIEPVGNGALSLAFESLKKKLEGEGLFSPARKRKLPFLPRGIGIVTSPTGAALRDFLRVLHLRHPGIPVLIAPARVQGDGAAAEVAEGLRRLACEEAVEVIVLARGGGSMEDLWAFNDEALARAIAACPVPVVSAIGHEIDFTIADFVADRRAPTPTGAAEILAPVQRDLVAALAVASQRLSRALGAVVQVRRESLLRARLRLGDPRRELSERRLRLADLQDRLQVSAERLSGERVQRLRLLSDRLQRHSPREALADKLRALHLLARNLERGAARAMALEGRRATLTQLSVQLRGGMQSGLRQRREGLSLDQARLAAISPQRVFERGYSLTRSLRSGQLVHQATQVVAGELIEVTVAMREREGELIEEKVRAAVV